MSKTKVTFPPEASIIHALRRTGYDWAAAMKEIIDNAVDAIRETYNLSPDNDGYVRIYTDQENGQINRIVVVDNGTGVDNNLLSSGDIFSLGTSGKRGTSALGTFGMGLKAAGISLGNKITIVSRTSPMLRPNSLTWDVSKSLKANKFEGTYNDCIAETLYEEFSDLLARSSGTMVIIENLHAGVLPAGGAFAARMKRVTSHVYRHMMNPASTLGYYFPFGIYVGKTVSESVSNNDDPLAVGHNRTDVLIGDKLGNFEKRTFRGQDLLVRLIHHKCGQGGRLAVAPNLGRYCGRGQGKQGVYFLREGREISSSRIWVPSQMLTNVYAEISFKDSGVGHHNDNLTVDFGKKGVVLQDEFKTFLEKDVFGIHLSRIKSTAKKAALNAKKSNRKSIMENIAKVDLPEEFGRGRKEPSASAIASSKLIKSVPNSSKGKTRGRIRGTSIKDGNTCVQLEFVEESWRGSPVPFDAEFVEGSPTVKILVNIAHPWVERNCYLDNNPAHVARCFQLMAAIGLANMRRDYDDRQSFMGLLGAGLIAFGEDFGRLETDNIILDKSTKTDEDILELDTGT